MSTVTTKSEVEDAAEILYADLNSIIGSSAPHSAYSDVISPLYGPPADTISFALNALERVKSIDVEDPAAAPTVPRITHRIWLSNPQEWHMPPQNYLEAIAKLISAQHGEWKHYFWTNVPQVGAAVNEYFQRLGISVEVADIRAKSSNSILLAKMDDLVREKKFVFAADVAKVIVLLEWGGIYSDLGVDYSPIIAEWSIRSDGSVVLDSSLILQLSFLALPPNALPLKVWSEILRNPDILTGALFQRDHRFGASAEVTLLTGPGFTAVFLLLAEADSKYLVVPYQSRIFRWSSQKSWYGLAPKFGNVAIRDTNLSLIDPVLHRQRVDKLETQYTLIGTMSHLLPRLRLLLSLGDFFRETETPLCHLLNIAGSDKAKGWHNYAYIYHYLLRRYVNQEPKLLEIGIGTNFIDTPSSMGLSGKPGASLRAWRKYFKNGQIAGADIDRRILFTEDGIKTFYVDQLSTETLLALAGQLKEEGGFDVIIDDGLHTFEANTKTFESLSSSLKPNGIFIIEDVVYVAISKWSEYFTERKLNACIVQPDNPKNPRDNCFVLVL